MVECPKTASLDEKGRDQVTSQPSAASSVPSTHSGGDNAVKAAKWTGALGIVGLVGAAVVTRANPRSLSVTDLALRSHEFERPRLVPVDPLRGFPDCVLSFQAD